MHHTTSTPRSLLRTTTLALVASTLLFAACGSDDDSSSATAAPPAATDAAATEPAATEPAATEPAATEPAATEMAGTESAPASSAGGDMGTADFCQAMVDLDAIDSPGGPTDPTPEQWIEFAGVVTPVFDRVAAGAPARISASVEAFTGYIEQFATGDGSAVETPEFNTDFLALEQAVRDDCGFPGVDVTATDYHFAMPESLAAGPTSFQMTNDAQEPHVLLFVRKGDDVTDDEAFLDEFLTAAFTGDPAAMAPYADVDVSGGGPFALPGDTAQHLVDLQPGTYIYFCPIPSGDGTGPMHYMLGMYGEFSVSA